MTEMWDGEQGPKEALEEEEEDRLASSGPAEMNPAPLDRPARTDVQDTSVTTDGRRKEEEQVEEEEGEELETSNVDPADLAEDLQQPPFPQTPRGSPATAELPADGPRFPDYESPGDPTPRSDSASLHGPESLDPDMDYDPDPDGDLEGDLQGGGAHPCLHCERHFSTKQGLERHIHIHTAANQQTHLFKCRYCGKSFGSQVGRRRHERRHESGAKKKPGSLAGTATLLSSAGRAGGSSPECASPTGHVAVGAQFPAARPPVAELPVRKDPRPDADPPFTLDEYGESKELHPCKYCNKAFGTHTNMRRHQRRIHERHLLPKGVRRKGMLAPEALAPRLPSGASPGGGGGASPPLVYVPSADTEDEADPDEYVVDISKNISENLSFYIDGKILSTSTVSNCEVIEVNSRSAALFGLDAMILGPGPLGQAFRAEGKPGAGKPLLAHLGQPTARRRTTTPPLLPSLKVERETGCSVSSSSSSSSTSSSSNVLVGALFSSHAAADTLAFQKEKTVYLSPKLKQLLQSQDGQRSAVSQATDAHRMASPLSAVPPLPPGAPGRFKRRTSSPPASPQLSPTAQRADGAKVEAGGAGYALKVPKLERLHLSPGLNLAVRDDGEPLCFSEKDPSGRGGNSCNQQPLDLSSSVARRSDTCGRALGDSALDLSMQRSGSSSGAAAVDPEVKGAAPPPPPPTKKRKPNTSMLEKVLMNEYAGLPAAGEEGLPAAPSGFAPPLRPPSPGTASGESAHPSPPALTPVTLNPASPAASGVTSPTPPPPVLPTIAGPDRVGRSPRSEPSDGASSRAGLPVLSPESSPRRRRRPPNASAEDEAPPDADDASAAVEVPDPVDDDENRRRLGSAPPTPAEDPLRRSSPPSPPEPSALRPPAAETKVPPARDPESVTDADLDVAPPPPRRKQPKRSSSTPPSPAVATKDGPGVHRAEETPDANHHAVDDNEETTTPTTKEEEEEEEAFCKTFVCNVCETPFGSIKALHGHIAAHAAEWPYKCEFCVQLFAESRALLAHRSALHGVGRTFVCSECSKEFAFLCNLQQHQQDLHPGRAHAAAAEDGKLRPHNYTDPARAREESPPPTPAPEEERDLEEQEEQEEEEEEEEVVALDGGDPIAESPAVNGRSADPDPDPEPEPDQDQDQEAEPEDSSSEELYTTIKIMASEGGKPKGPNVRLGLNQHYPSFKPPPFPYHSRSHAGSVASATNFTTHNIPQTFSTAIRCTKCGNGFDNMPELHKHILACANASDKKRYTPKKNPIPLKQTVRPHNGALSPAAMAAAAAGGGGGIAGQSAFRRMGQPKRLNFSQEPSGKTKMSSLSKKKNQLVQKAISQRNRTASGAAVKKASSSSSSSVKVEEQEPPEPHVCPHCSREFTYPASLSKHIAISCPMKPEPRKGKRADAKPDAPQMSLRRKAAADAAAAAAADADSEPKPLGKTRARSYGAAAEPDPPQPSRGRTGAPVGRPKRPASFPASPAAAPGKKSKKGQAPPSTRTPPPPPPSSTPTASDGPVDPPPRPVVKAQRASKEAAAKKVAEVNSSSPPAPKKEERFSLRTRERVGGPVTRSLQSVSAAAAVAVVPPGGEVKAEPPPPPPPPAPPSQEPKEPQETPLK